MIIACDLKWFLQSSEEANFHILCALCSETNSHSLCYFHAEYPTTNLALPQDTIDTCLELTSDLKKRANSATLFLGVNLLCLIVIVLSYDNFYMSQGSNQAATWNSYLPDHKPSQRLSWWHQVLVHFQQQLLTVDKCIFELIKVSLPDRMAERTRMRSKCLAIVLVKAFSNWHYTHFSGLWPLMAFYFSLPLTWIGGGFISTSSLLRLRALSLSLFL